MADERKDPEESTATQRHRFDDCMAETVLQRFAERLAAINAMPAVKRNDRIEFLRKRFEDDMEALYAPDSPCVTELGMDGAHPLSWTQVVRRLHENEAVVTKQREHAARIWETGRSDSGTPEWKRSLLAARRRRRAALERSNERAERLDMRTEDWPA